MGKLLFLHDFYVIIHCLLSLLLVFVIKCYVSNCIALCLVTLIVVRFLHLCACLNCPCGDVTGNIYFLIVHFFCN